MEILTNIENNNLLDEFHGTLLDGKIQASSIRGYPSKPEKKQQDAIGSIVKDENNFLNIVADGLGGTEYGEKASLQIVKEILNWYKYTPQTMLENPNLAIKMLKEEIHLINKDLFYKYRGNAQTTFVLSLTNQYRTLIANVGDSTIYTYNKELELLTHIKNYITKKTYEKIRKNIFSYLVSSAIGDIVLWKIHTNTIENNGQRLIMSSDGVTDLICEKRFTDYIINNVGAKEIVKEALETPDVIWKKEDNISAITIDLPKIKTL